MIKFDIWRLYFKLKLGVKEQIIENAISLFSENGYEGTTLNQIASSVDIKKASLYYHYNNKDEIYRSCIEVCINYFIDFIEEAHKDSNYSVDDLHHFLFNFIFNVDVNYIRLYLQLSFAPQQFKDEFLLLIRNAHHVLDNHVTRYYNDSDFVINEDDFRNMILMFLESWYLKCCFVQRYGVVQDVKNSFENEMFSLLNVILISK